ncbi:hypothetical protein EWM64_g8214 [Hericium alpestre]|uniref:Ferric oxidoreductase domain-containing protein n=1 Tax=Hericium alpestre TaxID=135208 RepID=A0A4Y9ZQL5_9AGAM|nr:hypothetical protein EWM64_g8214 [Hericium alpestre]
MSGFGTPPAIPTQFEIYNSYEVDPQWQRKFTAIWASFTGAAIVLALPYLVRSIRNRRAFTGLFGVTEDLNGRYEPITSKEDTGVEETTRMRTVKRSVLWASFKTFSSVYLYSPPGLGMDLGQILVVAGYLATVIACVVTDAQLISNANRAGFLAIAQLPVVFLFATKNSVLSLLLGPGNGWEKLNYVHRWSGRGMFLCGLLHGVLWIRNHLQYGLPILGPQKETSGVACFALLCLIVLSSLRPVRAYFYQVFFILHVLLYPALFITICYHTIYAAPYIYPPLAFYGLDLLMRALRLRIKDATLVPTGPQMTVIHVHDADGGWLAGQHMRLRVFISGRFFESQIAGLANIASNYLIAGQEAGRHGTAHPSIVPYQVFPCKNGYIMIGAGNDRQFKLLATHILDHPELADDARFSTNAARVANREALLKIITDTLMQEERDHWLERLTGLGVPFGPINDIKQTFDHPQAKARGVVVEVEHPRAGKIKLVGPAVTYNGKKMPVRRAPPYLSQHTKEVLAELGYSPEEMKELRQQGVI